MAGTAAAWRGWSAVGRRAVAERLALALLSALAVAALSSWGRSGLPVAERLAELALCVAVWELAIPASRAVLRRRPGGDPSGRLLCAVLLGSLPAAAATYAVLSWFGDRPSALPAFYGQSLALGLLLAFARRGLRRARQDGPAAAPATRPAMTPAPTASAFLRRHAPRLGGRLMALEAEDHYLRIHTDAGSALVLMRLRDAVAALGPEAGWQPHRSFWLAEGVEARAERSGQSWKLTLATGLVVPVSRANLPRLRAAGRIPDGRA